ncbi:hypothetical protein KKG31_05785 [Patescibacteria group bacterium]|nr:hypothetical protein [Patescibacteria group bacterium]MBU1758616.1 hypothetical protein [Patescibacteria group bacterium]
MALRVFCSTHDNDLFKEIDELDIDFNNQKQLFLFALRSISFSLRKVQYLLGIDTQTWFFYPKWFLESPSNEIKK